MTKIEFIDLACRHLMRKHDPTRKLGLAERRALRVQFEEIAREAWYQNTAHLEGVSRKSLCQQMESGEVRL